MVARMRINGDPAIMLALFSSVFRLLKCSNYAGHNRRKPSSQLARKHVSLGVYQDLWPARIFYNFAARLDDSLFRKRS